ncbi:hypothetical protein TorRG33x02_278950 [Trema orientale]|uniref:Uncharacterized protein n=1 Tax=Trema orientale TaxID=63057 RepID=A0A2P5CND2_TREOI|nr:hypothetical protein TorRG33x02_278950 [Trema orientale]
MGCPCVDRNPGIEWSSAEIFTLTEARDSTAHNSAMFFLELQSSETNISGEKSKSEKKEYLFQVVEVTKSEFGG